MIQESSADKRQSLYLYTDEDSYEPLARIDRNGNQEQHIYYFHTDLNDMPEELTDEAGEIVWGMLILAMEQTNTRDCPYRNTTEPEVSGTVFRQRNRTALQYFQVL